MGLHEVAGSDRDLLRFTSCWLGGTTAFRSRPAIRRLVVREFGSVAYFARDLGATIHNFHLAEHLKLVGSAARALVPPAVALENAPSSVEVVLRSQEGGRRWLLHLVNFTRRNDAWRPRSA